MKMAEKNGKEITTMKRNKMMRIASVLLIAALLSTSMISGTFAKYVTSAEAGDTARVAKWGVTVTAAGSLFDTTYNDTPPADDDAGGSSLTYTVVSSTTDAVVAPGTANTEQANETDQALHISVLGTPEVAVNVAFDVTNVKDVKLPAGSLLDFTTGNDSEDRFNLAADYYPVQFTLTRNGTAVVTDGKLADVKTALEALNGNYPANTNLDNVIGNLVLTWHWTFEENDKADTALGQIAAGEYSLTGSEINASIDIAVSVTQVD